MWTVYLPTDYQETKNKAVVGAQDLNAFWLHKMIILLQKFGPSGLVALVLKGEK